jgi:hypothetical protein
MCCGNTLGRPELRLPVRLGPRPVLRRASSRGRRCTRLLDDAVRFVTARILDHGPDLKPAYTTQGAAVPDQRTLDLPGYPGGKNLIGNWVNRQFQLDVFGEFLLLLAAAGRADRLEPTTGTPRSPPRTPSPPGGPNPTPESGKSTINPGHTAD